jgi:methionine synthase II (cobalamin-independent)
MSVTNIKLHTGEKQMADIKKAPFRADHVGSLLRPRELLQARERRQSGEMSAAALRQIEDRCIRDVVKMQEDIGLQSITDGEYRRTIWHADFLRQINGVIVKEGAQSGVLESFGPDEEIERTPRF